jgi:hypothetical protein
MKQSRSNAAVNGVASHSMNGHASLPELDALQSILGESAPSRIAVARWLQRHVSKEGLLLVDPWRTPDAARLLIGFDHAGDFSLAKKLERVSTAAAKLSAGKLQPSSAKIKIAGFVDPQSRSAVLRRSWSADSALLAVDFRKPECRIGLHLGGETIIDGAFATVVSKNGRDLEMIRPWEVVCESADADMEYLELATPIEREVYLDRHLFIARKAPIVWMVDVVRGDERADWRWSVRWHGVKISGLRGEAAHRGQRLLGLETQAALLPVSSPPDPFSLGGMKVALADGALELSQQETVKRLVAAIAWVWSPSGTLTLPPWRRLTITQDGRLTPPEEAFAFRVQAGSRQCVFYRALEHPRRHAFLGCQTFDETIIGEFDKKGDVKPWMRIE